MTATRESEVETLEHKVDEHLEAEAGRFETDVDQAGLEPSFAEDDTRQRDIRVALAVAFPVVAAAVMVGGIFSGVSPRIYAAVAGLLGIAVAAVASRIKRPAISYLVIVGGLFAIGLLMVIPAGLNNVTAAGRLASDAARSGNVLRPPVSLNAGWQAIIGWLMGVTGFAAGWVALAVERPPVALLVPMPVAAIAGISVPKSAQIASGIVVLVLFALGLGILSTVPSAEAEGERPPLSYELRRALRAVPLLAIITVALYLLAQADILFPRPLIDPTQEPQKPKTVPLSAVKDRVLFEVESVATGPWRIGSLDVYDRRDGSWRLPPFADNKLDDVPRDGIVDHDLTPGIRATFTIAGLGGAVLPGLPNPVGVVAEGPKLAYDARNNNIRLAEGQVQAGLRYTVVAAILPTEDDLRNDNHTVPPAIKRFTQIPDPPAALDGLLSEARAKGNLWDSFNFLRNQVLDNVTAVGEGRPVNVTPDRVADMLTGSKEGSPFEIVAAQAMLARWAGLPSRLGYGFDGGDPIGGRLQVRPAHGASFVEVYFPNYKWLPVIGVPKKAKPSVGTKAGQQKQDPSIVPSDDVAIELFMPIVTPPPSVFTKQLQRGVLIALPIILALILIYTFYPAVRKAMVRSRRRSAAAELGPRAQLALAYSEWRDAATDFGYRYTSDTPIMFLDRFVEDPAHTELAWLVTRSLWGDMQDRIGPDAAAAADELSRSLRRRLAAAHPATVRFVALVSRLSLRDPYAPDLNDLLSRKELHRDHVAVAAAPA
jgi:hypothetical protein